MTVLQVVAMNYGAMHLKNTLTIFYQYYATMWLTNSANIPTKKFDKKAVFPTPHLKGVGNV